MYLEGKGVLCVCVFCMYESVRFIAPREKEEERGQKGRYEELGCTGDMGHSPGWVGSLPLSHAGCVLRERERQREREKKRKREREREPLHFNAGAVCCAPTANPGAVCFRKALALGA